MELLPSEKPTEVDLTGTKGRERKESGCHVVAISETLPAQRQVGLRPNQAGPEGDVLVDKAPSLLASLGQLSLD